jgi:glycosyltransferase involved in cell wall biosynthesis
MQIIQNDNHRIDDIKKYFAEKYKIKAKILLSIISFMYYYFFVKDFTRLNYIYYKFIYKNQIIEPNHNTTDVVFEVDPGHNWLFKLVKKIDSTELLLFNHNPYVRYKSIFLTFILSHNLSKLNNVHILTLEMLMNSDPKLLELFSKLKCQKIATLHYYWLSNEEIKFLAQYFDKIIVLSYYEKILLENIGIKNCIYIPHQATMNDIQVDTKENLRLKFNIPNDKTVLNVAGDIRFDKGLEIFLKSLEFISQSIKNKIFINITGCDYINIRDRIKIQLENSGIEFRIDIRKQRISDEDYISNLKVSDFLIASYSRNSNNYSGVINDAVWQGVPVIATDFSTIGFEVSKWGLGYTFKHRNPQDLADKIIYAVNNGFIKKDGWNKFLEHTNPDNVIEIYKQLYKNIL